VSVDKQIGNRLVRIKIRRRKMPKKKMRVVALGGCGGMGRFAVRTALTYEFVDEIIIADLDGERARAFAQECGQKVSHKQIDVEDSSALKSLLSDADIVLTTVGPYYKFGVPILRSAIEVGCHYIDINDDWEPTLEMLDLDVEARKAEITAIVGLGASPGQSNMLAAKAMSLLDSVDELITGWGTGGEGGERRSDNNRAGQGGSYGAAIEHWLHQLTGTIRLFRSGEFVDVAPMEEVKIDYPGIGLGTVYTVGHPEPVTFPRSRPELKNSCNVMVVSPRLIEILRDLAADVDAGRMTIPEAAEMLMNPPEGRERQQEPTDTGQSSGPRLPGLFAYARGLKDGKQTAVGVTVSAGVGGGMGGATGVPMAIGLKMFATGQITRQGVFTPEELIDPDDFFNELGPLCSTPRANVKEMLIITTS
jgi:saccharopine dehydrogenase-like NADP-dependent oxidoreductase